MGIEYLIVGIMDQDTVLTFSGDDDIAFIPEIDQFLIFTVFDINEVFPIRKIRNIVDCSLNRIEISVILIDNEPVSDRSFFLRGETEPVFMIYPWNTGVLRILIS